MTVTTASTLANLTHVQMLPSQSQPTGKRKPEDFNPLLNVVAAKRAKKEAKLGNSSKRKLNHDDNTGGLLIVRAPPTEPSNSQPVPSNTTNSQPTRSASQSYPDAAGPSKPASKKFKASSQMLPTGDRSKPTQRDRVASSREYMDSDVEKDVRAMEDEADNLRRKSRAQSTISTSLVSKDANIQFSSRSEDRSQISRSKGKGKATEADIEEQENAQMERNRRMRDGSVDVGGRGRTMDTSSNGGHRRKSSVGRGKRTSTAYETSGIITQPHNSVSESSFYKHIDLDLPDAERIRQLLIWCSFRAAATTSTSSLSRPSSPSLPPLSAKGAEALKSLQDDLVRMLAEKRIDLSQFSPDPGNEQHSQGDLRENEQNVRNRHLEVAYSQHIQQAQSEEESWKKVSYGYDAYFKKLQSSLEKRAADRDPQGMSAKAKGKRRATGDLDDIESNFMPQEHELPPEFHGALSLAKSVQGHRPTGDERIAGRRVLSRSNLTREELEAEIKRRMPSLEYKIDQLFSFASAARATTDIAERVLNERFDDIASNLALRVTPFPTTHDTSIPGSATQLLTTYVMHPTATTVPSGAPDPRDVLRALSRVDQERPPAQVGDAARRAAREVQRANENRAGAVGDRKLTEVPATPRKAPGTPRRGTTPSRDR